MKNYVVTARIELPAESPEEAGDIVMGCEFYDINGVEVPETYLEIDEVREING